MTAPNAETIEAAAEQIPTRPAWLLKDQQNELSTFGDEAARALGATGLSRDFQLGYELGLETARYMNASGGKL